MKIVPNEEEKARLITEARILAQSSPVLIPMLLERRERTVKRLIGEYRNAGATQAIVAELSVIDDLLHEVRNKISNLNL
jgi:hypothetical protein